MAEAEAAPATQHLDGLDGGGQPSDSNGGTWEIEELEPEEEARQAGRGAARDDARGQGGGRRPPLAAAAVPTTCTWRSARAGPAWRRCRGRCAGSPGPGASSTLCTSSPSSTASPHHVSDDLHYTTALILPICCFS